jgi:hypothetical protein
MLILLELLWRELVTIVREKKQAALAAKLAAETAAEQETEINNEIAELLIS